MKQSNKQVLKKILACLIYPMLLLNSFTSFAMEPENREASPTNTKKLNRARSRTLSREKSTRHEEESDGSRESSQEGEKNKRRKSTTVSKIRVPLKRNASCGDTETYSHSPSASSPISMEEGDSDSPLGSPTKQLAEQEKAYMDCVAHLFKSSKSHIEIAKILIYSSPAFMDDKEFFGQLTHLKHKYPKIITEFLKQLGVEGVPNGIKNLQSAETELNELKKGLGDFPLLDMFLSNNFLQNDHSGEFIKILPSHNELDESPQINLENLDIGRCARALLFRDKMLFWRVPLNGLIESEAKNVLEMHAEHASNWFALQIISAPTEEKREKLIHKLGCLGRYLLNQNNFHGAMQVAMIPDMIQVSRLREDNKGTQTKSKMETLSQRDAQNEKETLRKLKVEPLKKETEEEKVALTEPKLECLIQENTNENKYFEPLGRKLEDDNWQILSAFSNPQINHKSYREWLSKAQKNSLNYLPFFSLIVLDFTHSFESFSLAPELKGKAFAVQMIAETLKTFSKHRTIPFPDIDPEYLKFMYALDVHAETLNVLSELRKSWPLVHDYDTQKLIPLTEWTPWYFASFLRQKGWVFKKKVHKIEEIFKLGIHEGKHIINYMGTENQAEKLYKLGLESSMVRGIREAYGLQLIKDLGADTEKVVAYYVQLLKDMEPGEEEEKEKKLLELGIDQKMVNILLKAHEVMLKGTNEPSKGENSTPSEQPISEQTLPGTDALPQGEIFPPRQLDNSIPLLSLDSLYLTEELWLEQFQDGS